MNKILGIGALKFLICIMGLHTSYAIAGINHSNIMLQPGISHTNNESPNFQREYVNPYGSNRSTYTNRQIVEASVMQSIAVFRTWFNTNVQTSDQLIEVATVLIADYYNKLRQCTPGVYRYPVPNILFGWRVNREIQPKYFLAESTILGKQNGLCIVNTATMMHDQVSRMHCEYSLQSLNYFNDKLARKAARNNLSYKQQERNKLDQIARECKNMAAI